MSDGLIEKTPGSGGLHKELFVIFTTPIAPREEILKILPKHLERQVELERAGILFAAGPMFEENKEGAVRGMIIVRASSFEDARKIADGDPLHKAGLRTYSIDRWIINEGSYTVNVQYSDQTFKIK
jgi:uncharacterized protein YciI